MGKAPGAGSEVTRTWTVATCFVIIAGCGEHAIYALTGQGFPRDLNLAYEALPVIYEQVGHRALTGAHYALGQEGGWYNLALAAWLHVLRPSGASFQLFAVPWFGLLLTATALLSRAWFGPAAALATTSIVAQMPILLLSSRLGWIHMPETALVVLATWAVSTDSGLAKTRTIVIVALTGALAITLRPSGILWMGVLGVLGTAGATRHAGGAGGATGRDEPERGARPVGALVAIASAWALALTVPYPEFRSYVLGKLDLHDRYSLAVPALLPQLKEQFGWFLLGCVALGAANVAASLLAWRRWSPSLRTATLTAWFGGSLVMYAIVRCGMDNFPLFYVAVALIAGAGLAQPPPFMPTGPFRKIAVLLPVAGWFWVTGGHALDEATGPRPVLPSTRLTALLDETCPNRRPQRRCVLLTDQGLTAPRSEEPGQLELFLMGERFVALRTVYQPEALTMKPAALASWSCGADDALWRQRRPEGDPQRQAVITRWGLAPLRTFEVDGCTFTWLTRGGL